MIDQIKLDELKHALSMGGEHTRFEVEGYLLDADLLRDLVALAEEKPNGNVSVEDAYAAGFKNGHNACADDFEPPHCSDKDAAYEAKLWMKGWSGR